MVLEYLPTFAQNHPNVGKDTSTMEHMGDQSLLGGKARNKRSLEGHEASSWWVACKTIAKWQVYGLGLATWDKTVDGRIKWHKNHKNTIDLV